MDIFLVRFCTLWSSVATMPVELLPELLLIKLADDSEFESGKYYIESHQYKPETLI